MLEFFLDGNHFNIFEEISQRDLGKEGEDYQGFKMLTLLIISVVLCLISTIAKKAIIILLYSAVLGC